MTNLIAERVSLARDGQNPYVICRMPSGWLVIGDVQPLAGYCLLLSDPIVESINALDENGRARYARDVVRIGDAMLLATPAYRINYETWGNSEPALHTHIVLGTSTSRQRSAASPPVWATIGPPRVASIQIRTKPSW